MESKIIRAEEVAKELDVSVPYAYKIIRKLNDELKAKGYAFKTVPECNTNRYGKPVHYVRYFIN